jgi:hypothetical protein
MWVPTGIVYFGACLALATRLVSSEDHHSPFRPSLPLHRLTPSRTIRLFAQWRLLGGRELGERLSDHLRHSRLDALKLLKPVGIGPELVQGPNVLSPQHVPGDGGK